ncbi:hypothetical protein [Domibacillus enclensis]|uniref:Hook-length control protein FliK n=1 Tax=Domibacillus enclensis TaxID=1017273 RepID=A0A1N6S9D7_9BACI|nr:hypothetical protein [Domibacillus enclensis]OXS79254.1 hypothetical protein B1B05_05645 [Domibacillus enclensis]SIQ37637.1 hypothetical protein SAMN05443094_102353 [Domibacillus enclensis]
MKIQSQAPASLLQPAAMPAQAESVEAESAQPAAPKAEKQPQEIAVFTAKGMTLTKEAKQAVQTFMETAPGTEAEKLATVKAMADKGIVPSESSLKAVHAALTVTPFGKQAAEWLNQSGIDFPENTRAAIEKALQLGRTQEAVKAVQSSPLPDEVMKQIEAIVKQGGSPEQLAQALKGLAQEHSLPVAKVVEQAGALQADMLQNTARQKLAEAIGLLLKQQPDHALLNDLARKLDQNGSLQDIVQALRTLFNGDRTAVIKPIAEALQLADLAQTRMTNALQPSGIAIPETDETEPSTPQKAAVMIQKEPSFDRITSFIKEVMPELGATVDRAEALAASGKELAARGELMKAIEPLIPLPSAEKSVTIPDELFAHVPPASKNVIMTTITEKMSQSAIDFKQFKRDIMRNLQTAELMIKTPQQAKPVVETAIKTLDNAILKGDFMLYTDMKTEKQLMQASQQLADARKLLAKGDTPAAARIVADVKALIDRVTFKPSDSKVMHMITRELTDTPQRNLAGAMAGLYDAPGARNAFELVRAAGLNYEHEQAAAMLKGKAEVPNAVKQALLATMNQPSGEQAAATLTGQQLLSKPESGLQSMMMSLPFLLGGQADSVNVFIRSKNAGQQVDWENCSIHFLFETKKLGPVGMTISAADRNLSVKIQNDQEGFGQKMEPLAVVLKNRLSDIGYRVGAVQFGTFARQDEQTASKTGTAASPAKGFDFTI